MNITSKVPHRKLKKMACIFTLLFALDLKAQSLFSQKENSSFSLGLGNTALYSGFEDVGNSGLAFNAGYYYGRPRPIFAYLDFHSFKGEQEQNYFSSRSLSLSFATNFYQLDGFSFAALAGLGFYLPKAKRTVNGELRETESKLIFGNTFGLESYLRLNSHYGLSFKYQYHNPFKVQQEVGRDLTGHYSMTTMSILYTL